MTMKLAKMVTVALLTLGAMAAHAQMPEPPAELKAIEWMVGNWEGDVHWTMQGMDETGKMTWKVEKDILFFKQKTAYEMMGMKMTEVGFTGWDANKKKYWSQTFTNYGPTPRTEWGTLEKDKMTFVSDPWDMGMPEGPMTSRSTMTKKSNDEVLFVLEFKMGDTWQKAGEGTFKRKKV